MMTGSEPSIQPPPPDAEPPPPQPQPARRKVYRPPLAALAAFLAAALTAAGASLPLFTTTVRLGFPNAVLTLTITAWDLTTTANGLPDAPPEVGRTVPANGTPLIIAVAVLLVAAVLVKLAAANPALARAGGVVTAAGAAFLAGVVATVGMQVFSWMEQYQPRGQTAAAPDLSIEVGTGIGFWLLAGGVVLAVAAAVLALRPAARAGAGTGEREEPETPRFGIPVVVHRLPDAPPDEPDAQR